jgi:hypothetical protein
MLEFPVGRALCTSQPLVFDFLENAAGNLFTLVPRLKGLLLITASEHLHHCLSFSTPVYPELYEKQYANLCPKCRDRDATAMVSSIVNRLAQGAYHARPDAEIIAWNWDWSWYDAAPYEKIIRQLDPRISLATNLNLRGTKEDPVGTRRRINEYALSYVGPSEHCQKCAEFARNSGRKFFVQMVLGTTHELATVPCIPVPHRVYEKVVEARRLNAEGYLGWTFGSMPCVNLAVAARVRSLPSIPENKEDFLRCFAAEYLPGCNADLVCKAWRFFAMGIDLYPFDNRLLYYGPVNYALAYKQFPGPVLGKPMTQSWLDLPREGDDLDSCCGPFSPEILIERFDLMADRFEEGVAYYRKGTKNVAEPRKSLELGNAAIIALIFRSVANIFRIHMLKKAWAPSQARAFRRILKDELAICRKALPLVKADSRLGFHTECQAYQFSEALIRGKIRHICDLLPS